MQKLIALSHNGGVLSPNFPRFPKEAFGLLILFLFSLNLINHIDYSPIQFALQGKVQYGPEVDEGHYFGPVPLHYDTDNTTSYEFTNLKTGFRSFELWRAKEFTKRELQDHILSSVPKALRKRLRKYLPYTLQTAQKYQVDPFWVLSVMWTESHFIEHAKSHVKARGLMQIMPGTGHYLANLLDLDFPKSRKERVNFIYNVNTNIEMGVFYLKYLLKRFRGNYVLATVAYNMGPGWVINHIKKGRTVGARNKYLTKIQYAYRNLSKGFISALKQKTAPYEETYAYRYRIAPKPNKKFELYPHGLPVDVAQNESKGRNHHIFL